MLRLCHYSVDQPWAISVYYDWYKCKLYREHVNHSSVPGSLKVDVLYIYLKWFTVMSRDVKNKSNITDKSMIYCRCWLMFAGAPRWKDRLTPCHSQMETRSQSLPMTDSMEILFTGNNITYHLSVLHTKGRFQSEDKTILLYIFTIGLKPCPMHINIISILTTKIMTIGHERNYGTHTGIFLLLCRSSRSLMTN